MAARRLDRLEPNSDAALMYQWRVIARDLGDRLPTDLSAVEWADLVDSWRERPSPRGGPTKDSTVLGRCVAVKTAAKYFWGPSGMPDDVHKALSPELDVMPDDQPRVIDDVAFQALLGFCAHNDDEYRRPRHRAEMLALLWVLRDGGMSPNEMLGLNVGDVSFKDGGAYLVMRKKQVLVKNKYRFRTVPIVRAAGPLKVWLGLHPAGLVPDAPLFCSIRSPDGMGRLSAPALDKLLKRAWSGSGLSSTRLKKLSAYDFRITSATEAADLNWSPSKARSKYGWGPKSAMWLRYARIRESHVMKQMLRDAGLDETGRPIRNAEGVPADVVAALALLKQRFPQAFSALREDEGEG